MLIYNSFGLFFFLSILTCQICVGNEPMNKKILHSFIGILFIGIFFTFWCINPVTWGMHTDHKVMFFVF